MECRSFCLCQFKWIDDKMNFFFLLFQVRSLSSVSLKAATEGLPIRAIGKSIVTFTHRISLTIARSEAATSPIRIRPVLEST